MYSMWSTCAAQVKACSGQPTTHPWTCFREDNFWHDSLFDATTGYVVALQHIQWLVSQA